MDIGRHYPDGTHLECELLGRERSVLSLAKAGYLTMGSKVVSKGNNLCTSPRRTWPKQRRR